MKKRFKKIYIENINQCNLSCDFCPAPRRAPGRMTAKQFIHVLDQIRSWTDYIYLHVKGEPLLHPQLDQLLEAAANFGFYVNLTTNGTLLRKKGHLLLEHPVRQVNISLHSFDANIHMPGGMSFRDYIMSTIDFAMKFSPEHGITAFRLWNQRDDLSQPLPGEPNDEILQMLAESFSFTGSLDPVLYQTNDARLAPDIYLSFDRKFDWPALDAPDYGSCGTCLGLKSHAAILCDGTVIPCCLDGDGIVKLGNIFTQSFQEILEGPRSQNLQKDFQTRQIREPLCRRCGYRTRF